MGRATALLRCILAGAIALSLIREAAGAAEAPVTFGLTPAILHEQQESLSQWAHYLESRLGRPVQLITRDRYSDTIGLLQQGKLDFAWVSDYPFVALGRQVRLLAVPLYQGRPLYCSYLIVPATDRHTRSIRDLRGSVFAFADPHSNTGYLQPRYELMQSSEDPDRFFRRTFFTWSHRDVAAAVAQGLADGGAIDSFVWDSLARVRPELTSQTRIAARSEQYGFPPIVANRMVGAHDFQRMQRVLLGMSADPDGAALLRQLNLDGFVAGDRRLYARVGQMMQAMGER